MYHSISHFGLFVIHLFDFGKTAIHLSSKLMKMLISIHIASCLLKVLEKYRYVVRGFEVIGRVVKRHGGQH